MIWFASLCSQAGLVRVVGSYLWHAPMTDAPLRDRRSLPGKSIHQIAPEEIEVAIDKVVGEAFGMLFGDVARCVANVFGFLQVTANMRSVIEPILTTLLDAGKLTRSGDSVLIASLPLKEPR